MDLSYLASSFVLLTVLAAGLYFILFRSFRRAIVSVTDPLNYWAAIVAFYLAGALFLPFLHEITRSYIYIVVLIFLYLIAAAIWSAKKIRLKSPELNLGKEQQLLFATIVSGMLIVNLVVNQIFGVIPLLHGTAARADYGSVASPTLYFLSPDMGMIILLILLLTRFGVVRAVAAIGVLTSLVSTILGGAKSSVFSILFVLCVADHIVSLKRKTAVSALDILKLDKSRKLIRAGGMVCLVGILLILPAFLVLLGAASGGGGSAGLVNFGTRLFGGFDALAIIMFQDIDITSIHDVNISAFYFYPLLKKISHPPEFQSAGEYLIYLLTGNYRLSQSGLNPNSNYAIELLISNGSIVISGVLIVITAICIFRLRTMLLERGSLRIFDLVLWSLIVLAPFSILLDGAYFVIRLYELIALYMTINLAVNLLMWLRPGRKLLRLL